MRLSLEGNKRQLQIEQKFVKGIYRTFTTNFGHTGGGVTVGRAA